MKLTDEEKAKIYKDKLELIKSYPIEQYAQELGFSFEKKGRYFRMCEHHSVMIDPRNNTYCHYSQSTERKTIIDFSMEFEDINIKEAWRRLGKLVANDDFAPHISNYAKTQKKEISSELELPPNVGNVKSVFAYLVKTRCIDPKIVQGFIKNKNLYQDDHANCVFVSYDDEGKANFASKRGTNTFYRFMGDCVGCDYKNGFLTGNREATTMIVCESVIDSLSVMTILKKQGKSINEYAFLSLGGVAKFEAVCNQIKKHPQFKKIVLALDNDNGGHKCVASIEADVEKHGLDCRIVKFIPKEKDWNSQLQLQSNEKKNVESNISSLEETCHKIQIEMER